MTARFFKIAPSSCN